MTITRQQVDAWDDEVDAAYKRGLHDGMKQERALWELSRLGQEIEAQPEQDAAAFIAAEDRKVASRYGYVPKLHPSEWQDAQRPWVGLTDEERDAIQAATLDLHGVPKFFATAIEAKLQSKNT